MLLHFSIFVIYYVFFPHDIWTHDFEDFCFCLNSSCHYYSSFLNGDFIVVSYLCSSSLWFSIFAPLYCGIWYLSAIITVYFVFYALMWILRSKKHGSCTTLFIVEALFILPYYFNNNKIHSLILGEKKNILEAI